MYGFFSFDKNMGTHLSNKYSQELLVVLRNLQQCNKNYFKKINSNGKSNG